MRRQIGEAEKNLWWQNYFVNGTKILVAKKNERTFETFAILFVHHSETTMTRV